MNELVTEKTHDISKGWFASLEHWSNGEERLTVRNPEKGQRISLDAASTKRLREIVSAV